MTLDEKASSESVGPGTVIGRRLHRRKYRPLPLVLAAYLPIAGNVCPSQSTSHGLNAT